VSFRRILIRALGSVSLRRALQRGLKGLGAVDCPDQARLEEWEGSALSVFVQL